MVDRLKEFLARANLPDWETWSTQYRVLAVVLGLLVAYWALRVLVPVMLRVLRPAIFAAIVLVAVWALFPKETCSIEFVSRIPMICAR